MFEIERKAGECCFTMAQIKQANRDAGQHFFERGTMRFFRSKVATRRPINGAYFVTSEQFDDNSPRLYTVRRVDLQTGKIDTVGEFQAWRTLRAAKSVAFHAALNDPQLQ